MPARLPLVIVTACRHADAPAEAVPPGPDDRFLTADACPAPIAGLTLEETAPFTAGGAPSPLVVVMGGGAEVDAASARFAAAAGGGDVLVLRATGSTSSYTSYFSAELTMAPKPSSVATLRVDDPSAAADDSALCRVARADAIWLAGGDQSDYLVAWPASLHESLARAVARGIAIGGTSAGAMSLSALAFDARSGSLDSPKALADPLADAVSLVPSPFAPAALDGTLVDTHFTQRDRLGRLVAFLARSAHDGTTTVGLGIDEDTAVVLDGGRVDVLGSGEAWLVSLDGEPSFGAAGLTAAAWTAPLSGQSAWPPVYGDGAPGSQAYTVVNGQ